MTLPEETGKNELRATFLACVLSVRQALRKDKTRRGFSSTWGQCGTHLQGVPLLSVMQTKIQSCGNSPEAVMQKVQAF